MEHTKVQGQGDEYFNGKLLLLLLLLLSLLFFSTCQHKACKLEIEYK